MIIRRPTSLQLLYTLLFLSWASSPVWADDNDPFDCKVTLNDVKYDLSTIAGEQSVSRERDSPPTKMRDTLRFNICGDLKKQDGVTDEDQCPSESRACLTKTNIKSGQKEQITSVIPLANSTRGAIEFEAISSPNKGIALTFKGPSYPSSTTLDLVPQSFNIRILCDTDPSPPVFVSYDGKEAKVEWKSAAGCSFASPPDSPDKDKPSDDNGKGGEKESEKVGSGLGYFFLLLFLAFVGYFALGAYYNYSTYGATGADLIPHRDFWREVPYMLRDVVSHLCSTVRPRHSGSRSGYIAV